MKSSAYLRFVILLGATFCLCLIGPNSACAQMLLNGSFENPALTGTTFTSGSGTNWTASAGIFVLTNNFGFGITPYGNQWDDFGNNATDTQTINSGFVANVPYTLSLAASDISGYAGDQLTISVSGSATASQTFAVPARTDGQNPGALPLATYALTFTPTATGPVTVTLATGSGGGGIAVDNVQLVVPEPSTWALLLAAVALLSGGAYWRQRKRACFLCGKAIIL